MGLFSWIFGGGKASPKGPEPVEYKGFKITPDPINEGGSYRVAARIEKDLGGAAQSHQLVRADTTGIYDDAVETSVFKAKMLIDEQGDRIFG